MVTVTRERGAITIAGVTLATEISDARARTTVSVEPVGTRIDVWWSRTLSTPLRRRVWVWGGPIAVTLLAAVLRLWNLGSPRRLVFDETYYVKDAYSLVKLGYEGRWPEGADARFVAGNVDIFSSDAAYIAHPPLGKWIISLGLQVFGAEDPAGWRISTAIVGVLAVALICLIAFALFRSTLLATVAGGLLAVDGLAIVMSRTALLDNSLMFLALLGFGAVLLDRRQSAARLARWMTGRAHLGGSTHWGPALWWRPWLLTAGLLFGLATAVKWSGLYFLAAFAVYTLVVDAVARRRAGVQFWLSSTLLRQAPVSFLLTVPVAAAAYLASWTGWLVTDGGYDRDWAKTQGESGILASLQSLWHYQVSIYTTNVGQESPHAYQANPLGWLLLIRPTAFLYDGSVEGEDGCVVSTCARFITSIANPLLWWLAVAAALYLLYRLIRRREWQVGLILTGVAAGYLPWLLYTERTVFQFYTIVFLPYLVLGLTFALGLILGRPTDASSRRLSGIRVTAIVLGFIVLVSAFFWPAWTGLQVSGQYQQLHYWLPTWR
ncbi:MAG: hypothetical protein JWL94_493 [Microbacteriaceae bacterium]|nr:hypothetical protein [Microbacteriaceae bacterium]